MADIKEYTFIKNIDELVEKKLKELKLSPKIPFNLKELKKDNRRFYSVPCIQNKKKQVFLKILVVKEEVATYTLKKEIEITKFLSDVHPFKKGLNIPLFIDCGSKDSSSWLLHEYLPGPLVGYFYEVYKKGSEQKVIKKIVNNLISLQSIPVTKHKTRLSKIPITERGFKYYLQEIEFRKGFLKKEREIPFKAITGFVKDRKKYFKAEVLAHGDYTLANFFIHKNKIYVTDWEHAHLDNFTSDIAHLWSQAWRYPKWRKRLILYFLAELPKYKNKKFKELFRAMALIEALGELAFGSEICEKKYKTGAKKAAKKTIEATFKSFYHLINL